MLICWTGGPPKKTTAIEHGSEWLAKQVGSLRHSLSFIWRGHSTATRGASKSRQLPRKCKPLVSQKNIQDCVNDEEDKFFDSVREKIMLQRTYSSDVSIITHS